MTKSAKIAGLTDHLFRENSGKMVAVLSRLYGLNHIESIMDVVQDTFEAALTKWRFSGVPQNPSAWLMTVAKNKAINAIKRENKTVLFPTPADFFQEHLEGSFPLSPSRAEVEDSQLQLLIVCCHPAISSKNQIILTLNVLCGFGIPEIANGLLMTEEAAKKGLVRSKAVLKQSNLLFNTPLNEMLGEEISTIQTILYLLFNEGYKSTRKKDGINKDLCYEALRLSLLILKVIPERSEIQAFIALMFFSLARFPARIDEEGNWLSLKKQNRKLWSKPLINEGMYHLRKATRSTQVSELHLEALISSVHCSTPTFEKTDWKKISFLYKHLERVKPNSPIVRLNRIISESYLLFSEDLITEIKALEKDFPNAHRYLLYAAKGDLYERLGKSYEAQKAFTEASEHAKSPIDRRFFGGFQSQ